MDTTLQPLLCCHAGRELPADEEQQAHVRCAGGFESPETLQGLVAFLRRCVC